ncbi:6499_t:CDS:10 [Paraglomus occultum]|uniref:6499_t:CDS:1 n=1 Tax=Paraglomus occultum TaxID=144539 RepID=A0A9N8YXB5_9GLOM|nr:6499_t:CDS:10 [Paraglomus occultum]
MRRGPRRRVSYVISHDNKEQGHFLGANSLALDTTTVNPKTGRPEGILYTAGRDGLIYSWDLHLPFRQQKKVSSSSANGLLGKNVDDDGDENESWEVDSDRLTPSIPTTFRQEYQGHTDWVNDIVLCHGNETLISASSDRTLQLWHPHKSNKSITIGYHSDYIKALAYAPGPCWVASGGFDRKIAIWDINECRPSSAITSLDFTDMDPRALISETSPKSSIYALACNPSGTVIVSGSPEKIIRVWDPRSNKQIMKFTGHTDNIRAVLVSDDGDLILSGSSDTTIKLWSLSAQRCVNTFTIHSDSVWALYSDHPRLETFYTGSKDGLVTRTDYSGDGECVAISREAAGVMKILALDNEFIWTATAKSTINRWLDVPSRSRRRAKAFASASSSPPTSPSSSVSPSALIKLSYSYNGAVDSDAATVHSMNVHDDSTFGDDDLDDPIPIRDAPDTTIQGQHGLTKHCSLNNRRHVLTVDTAGECVKLKTFGKRDLEEVYQEINTIESIPTWAAIDTRIGALTIHLDEFQCFDAEVYADEIESPPEDYEFREDYRVNLGKWVLRYLFQEFTQAEIKAYEESRAFAEKQQQSIQRQQSLNDIHKYSQEALPQSPTRATPPNHISFPPATMQAEHLNDRPTQKPYQRGIDILSPKSPTSTQSPIASPTAAAMPNSPTKSLAAFAGPFTAPATTGPTQDYFSDLHKPPTPTSPSTQSGAAMSENKNDQAKIQLPPPALVNQGSNNTGSSSFVTSIFRSINNARKARSPNADPKTENLNYLEQPKDYPNSRVIDKKLVFRDQDNEEPPKTDDEEETKSNSPTSKSDQTVKSDTPSPAASPVISQPIRQLHYIVQPPFAQIDPQDTPTINIPHHTKVIISEDSSEASTSVVIYRGTVGTLANDAELIEQKAPLWLLEFLIKNKVLVKEQPKVSFVLKPHEGSNLNDLPTGIRKVLSYVVEKLELSATDSQATHSATISDKQDSDSEAEKRRASPMRPEMWLELLCNDQPLQATMTLSTVRNLLWKSDGGDLIMTYRLKIKDRT